ncbi:band 4.1-like protein 4 isoform X2 [Chrysoperla carnea]|uniref:band 4.1-like protein 4 isoform X2 n=1 Tax=Chrysoperla carnea TaxID=189513 RepID=UPI001D060A0B|nr:band 4.1-like protein 4 isoform X2 [Chrysoperla carnea]
MRDYFCFLCPTVRVINCSVFFLDDHTCEFPMEDNNTGQMLLEEVFHHLNLMETAYFGLRYLDSRNQTHWLDPTKTLHKQLNWNTSTSNRNTDTVPTYVLYFGVKFYAVDPCKLIEEITRYQFFLQVKQDVLQGRLPVSFEMAAELGGYIVQSELGDYDPQQLAPGYLSEFRFLHSQTVELENRIAEYHKANVGMPPSMAELNYLEKVKWLELYGVDLHAVLGEDNVDYFLGLTPSGIVVLRNTAIVGNYYWPRITKIHFTGCYFMLRVADKNNDESTYGFETPSKAACKHLWKCCLEHHAFFRLYQVSPSTAADIFGLGSRFRFSGRTEKQAAQDAKLCVRAPPSFSRTLSHRRNADGTKSERNGDNSQNKEIKLVSIPQPVQISDNPYRSLTNIGTTRSQKSELGGGNDSPRSTRSAPWTQSQQQKGLYGNGGTTQRSPSSLDAIVSTLQRSQQSNIRQRSSSVDSHSSTDSRSMRGVKYRHHQSRAHSDNESELSKSSNRSRRHRHSSGHRRSTGTDMDPSQMSSSKYEDLKLVESKQQWREVQRLKNGRSVQQANIVTNRRSSVVNSCHESESEMSYRQNASRRHRKHRSRSRSPAEAKAPWLSEELKKHVEFDLIDTTGMSQAQLKEIPYTVVKTSHAKQVKLKYGTSNSNKKNLNVQSKSSHMIQNPEYSRNTNGAVPGFNHEHTDSGLGGEQEYEDRWIQSARRYDPTRSSASTTHDVTTSVHNPNPNNINNNPNNAINNCVSNMNMNMSMGMGLDPSIHRSTQSYVGHDDPHRILNTNTNTSSATSSFMANDNHRYDQNPNLNKNTLNKSNGKNGGPVGATEMTTEL